MQMSEDENKKTNVWQGIIGGRDYIKDCINK